MTESGLEMRSNPPQNSSISLPLAPLIGRQSAAKTL